MKKVTTQSRPHHRRNEESSNCRVDPATPLEAFTYIFHIRTYMHTQDTLEEATLAPSHYQLDALRNHKAEGPPVRDSTAEK